MSSSLRATLIAGGVTLVLAFVIGFALAALGIHETWLSYGMPGLIGVLLYTALSENRRVPVADDGARAAALASAVPHDRARLIVHRQGFNGKLVGVDISVDDTVVAQLVSPRFAVIHVAPGPHQLGARSPSGKPAELAVTLTAGSTTFVRVIMSIGRLRLEVETDIAAVQKTLAATPMVESSGFS